MSQAQLDSVATRPASSDAVSWPARMPSETDWIMVTVSGQLEVESQPILALTLAKAITDGRIDLVVDLEALDLIDLEDVGLLIRARSLLRSRGQHLVVRSPCVIEILAACALLDPLARVDRVHANRLGNFASTDAVSSEAEVRPAANSEMPEHPGPDARRTWDGDRTHCAR
jgi:anti-sigma B factor antagonist